jgi:hypothetical protein
VPASRRSTRSQEVIVLSRSPDARSPSPPPPEEPAPLPATVRVTPWIDPVVDRRGHDPRSSYVETFWLSVLGPTATWLLRRLVAGFDGQPAGYDLDVAATARALGLSVSKGTASPFAKAVQRCVMFGVAHTVSDGWAVRRRLPPISQRHLARLPDDLRAAHTRWIGASTDLGTLERGRTLAVAMIQSGDDRGMLEPQLVAVGVPAPAAAEVCALVLRQAGGDP